MKNINEIYKLKKYNEFLEWFIKIVGHRSWKIHNFGSLISLKSDIEKLLKDFNPLTNDWSDIMYKRFNDIKIKIDNIDKNYNGIIDKWESQQEEIREILSEYEEKIWKISKAIVEE